MKYPINTDTWERGSTFRHFIRYSNPYFGICTEIDFTNAYLRAKELKVSFFLYYFYLSLSAANSIPAFRTRLEGISPVLYDKVNGSPTVLRHDGGLGFAMLEYAETFVDFLKLAGPELERVRSQTVMDASKDRPDTIYYSIIPWIRFTSVSHPLDLPNTEGVPILTFGKTFMESGKVMMPLGIHAHHALMDGMHVHLFLEAFRKRLNECTV